jgi:hypothetical protein
MATFTSIGNEGGGHELPPVASSAEEFSAHMVTLSDTKHPVFTAIDVELADAYYPILLELARERRHLTYGDLVEEAKRRYPGKPVVQRAIPRSTGRRLEVIGVFCAERNLPNLTALVLNKVLGEVGRGFDRRVDPQEIRAAIFAHDWHALSPEFEGYLTHRRRTLAPRKRVTAATARALMSQYYIAHKPRLPKDMRPHRPLILELIEEGFSAEEAFCSGLICSDTSIEGMIP